MALDLSSLDRAGLHVTRADVGSAMNVAFDLVIPPFAAVGARSSLTPAELQFLADAGVADNDLAHCELGSRAPEVQTALKYAALLATALRVPEVAAALRVDGSSIRHRLAARTLYGVRDEGNWRLPLFQFTDDRRAVVPGVPQLAPVLHGAHPVAVLNWFTLPHADLLDETDQPLSPRAWLLGGGSVDAVLALADGLRPLG